MKAHSEGHRCADEPGALGGGVLLALPGQTSRPGCVITGRVLSSGTALPGVSVTATREGQVVAATSTDTNGAYRLRINEGEFVVSAELAAFARFEQTLTSRPIRVRSLSTFSWRWRHVRSPSRASNLVRS